MRILCFALAALIAVSSPAGAFCGFYVATLDEPLTNKASRVVLVHQDGHTLVTMASDVHGDPKEFALVIPVPTVIRREQVRIVKPETVEHLADYTKPRLVQYFDPDPCAPPFSAMSAMALPTPMAAMPQILRKADVRIEAAFSVEEYDIKVLAAADSRRPDRLAEPQRLPHSAGRRPGDHQLPAPGHAFLRGQGEPRPHAQ